MGTRRSRHNKGRKPLYKEHRRGPNADYLAEKFVTSAPVAPAPEPVRRKPPPEVIAERNKARRPYVRESTGRVINAGFNYLSDIIVRPGIEKRLWPILLYRGVLNRGQAHRMWNLALLMMASEAETLADGLKLLANPAFNQLCGPVRTPPKFTMNNFFGRLWDNPDTTDLIPHFTEYVRSLELGPSRLTPVPLETNAITCAEWRISLHPNPRKPWDFKPEHGAKQLFYPYMVHDVTKPDDGHDLVKLVNEAVPPGLPEQWRADVCQEMVLGILSGDISRGSIHDHVRRYIAGQFKANPILYEGTKFKLSLDAPVKSDEGTPISDALAADSYDHWEDNEVETVSYEDAWEDADRNIAARNYRDEQTQERNRFFGAARMHQRATQIDDVYQTRSAISRPSYRCTEGFCITMTL